MSTSPWGVLSDNHVFQLVVRENERPDRLDLDFEHKRGLTDRIWKIIEAAWQKEANLRPTFVQIVKLWERPSEESVLIPLRSSLSASNLTG